MQHKEGPKKRKNRRKNQQIEMKDCQFTRHRVEQKDLKRNEEHRKQYLILKNTQKEKKQKHFFSESENE